MLLSELLSEVEVERVKGRVNIEVEGIASHSRGVKKGFLFVAIPGFSLDGHKFIPEAVKKGAVAVVAEKEPPYPLSGCTWVKVPHTRKALAKISACFYRYPSRKLRVIGVTGTNGKTTVVYFLESILREAGYRVGKITTVDYELGEGRKPSSITTPDSLQLQFMLHQAVRNDLNYLVMEVSSHALSLHRVEGVEFDVGIFTNLSLDHLDFHKTLENYLEAKLKLFQVLGKGKKRGLKVGIINIDDPSSSHFIKNTRAGIATYGIEKKASLQGEILELGFTETSFLLKPRQQRPFKAKIFLLGKHNVYNALAASALALVEGVDRETLLKGLENLKVVPGRLEPVPNQKGIFILVDYAHTPAGLKKVLSSLQGGGKIILVFGCGGDRDKGKRPLMGEIAIRRANFTVVTSDNPRSEDPLEIIAQIEKGMKEAGGKEGENYVKIPDRRRAIKFALERAKKGDILLVAGKGHERVQIFKDRRIEFDDREVIKELLKE